MPTLNWIGKEKVINHHRDVPFKILEHKYGFNDADGELKEPVNSGNKIIHGDNLEALKSLLPEYEGKIKCIYIDPPYNTGNENWVYNDNVNHPKIKKWLEATLKAKESGKEAAIGIDDLARHDKWLCMMYPRLKLLQKLLADDGAIFISIDDNEQANLKLICDEILGINNFVTSIIWQRAYAPVSLNKYFSTNHDFLLCYAKNKIKFTVNKLPRSEKQNKDYKNPDNDYRGPWKSGNPSVGPAVEKNIYEIVCPSGRVVLPPKGRSWLYSKEKFEELKKDNRIWFGKDGNSIWAPKLFLSEVSDGVTPMTTWLYEEVGHTQDAKKELKEIFEDDLFATPKPTTLLQRIIRLIEDKNAIILDSFAGSGTTAHAVLNLNKQDGGNRKFVLVELEDYANTITAERVKRVIKGYGDKEGTGGSFDYYELGKPLFVGENNEYLNEEVDTQKIREYIWYSETRKAFEQPDTKSDTPYFLGKKEGTAYYFIYEKESLTTLDYDTLSTIKTKAGQYVIYADNCLLPKDFMMKKNIVFKKIPRDVTRF